MNIYTGLLFQQGYIQDPALAISLANEAGSSKAQSTRQAERPNRAKRPERGPSFRRGAIFAACSTALSPFR